MTQNERTEKSKADLIRAYVAKFGNVTRACEAVGVSRRTFYNYRADAAFAEAIDDAGEGLIDDAEDALKKRIRHGDTTAIIFFLKTKGKKRGYVERQEIEHGLPGGFSMTALKASMENFEESERTGETPS